VIDIVEFLVFSIVMLMFMAYPAIKIVEFIDKEEKFSEKKRNFYMIFFTILLSLLVGAFLKYAPI
jgi:uncharacterized membrane protein YwzB